MTTRNLKALCGIAAMALLLCAGPQTACAQTDWVKTGSNPDDYILAVDSIEKYDGHSVLTLKSIAAEAKGFGSSGQDRSPSPYAGKRLRMTAYLKSKDVAGWSGFWLRIDKGDQPAVMDNMSDRPVKATTDWKKYSLVVDVPEDASNVVFGGLLIGTGQIWFTHPVFDVVDNSVPTTSRYKYD